MVALDLTEEEQGILHKVLAESLSDLRMEIVDTERQEFRDGLKQRKAVIEKVLTSLGTPLASG